MKGLPASLATALLLSSPAAAQAPAPAQPSAVAAEPDAATEGPCLTVIDVPDGGKYRLGHAISIRVEGECLATLENTLDNGEVTQAAVLHLNRLPMPKLPLRSVERADGPSAVLEFGLVRNSSDSEDRSSWDQLLGAHTAPDFPLRVGVSIGGGMARRAGMARDPSGRIVPALFFGVSDPETIYRAIALSLVALAASWFFLLWHPHLLRDPGGRYSLAKSQMAFWGTLVFIAFCALWGVTKTMESLPSQVLTLLGISATTGVVAVAANRRSRTERRDLTWAESFQLMPTFFSDICRDAQGATFHRLQAVMWTGLLGVIFARSVMGHMSMPTFDESLLWLMGISSATYLGLKFPEDPKPSVEPGADGNGSQA